MLILNQVQHFRHLRVCLVCKELRVKPVMTVVQKNKVFRSPHS